LRIVGGAGDTDSRVGGNEQLLGLADIGAALEKLRGNACGNFGGVRLLGEAQAALDGARVISEQGAEKIFSLLDAAFEVGDFFAGGVDELFSLADVKFRRVAMI